MIRCLFVVAMVVCSTTSSAQAAEGSAPADVYGEGMKAFYRGDYMQAIGRFTQAIDAGSKDPRCYYFRGLSQARSGRSLEAQGDFQEGAALEANDFDVFYNTSEALERVQGRERIVLESYRAAGRKKALAEVEKIRFEHYRRFNPGQGVAGPASTAAGATPAAAPGAVPPPPAAGLSPFDAPPAAPDAPVVNPFGTPAAPTPNP